MAQFSLYVHKSGLKPDSFHFVLADYVLNPNVVVLADYVQNPNVVVSADYVQNPRDASEILAQGEISPLADRYSGFMEQPQEVLS